MVAAAQDSSQTPCAHLRVHALLERHHARGELLDGQPRPLFELPVLRLHVNLAVVSIKVQLRATPRAHEPSESPPGSTAPARRCKQRAWHHRAPQAQLLQARPARPAHQEPLLRLAVELLPAAACPGQPGLDLRPGQWARSTCVHACALAGSARARVRARRAAGPPSPSPPHLWRKVVLEPAVQARDDAHAAHRRLLLQLAHGCGSGVLSCVYAA